ncbi:hypothetical protein HanPI659440_Chr13g0511231 [Helianthus annuus]|nr:hypothetical protein HanPI659440_Chr13g0511231 [Helianthus annuus]
MLSLFFRKRDAGISSAGVPWKEKSKLLFWSLWFRFCCHFGPKF